MRCEFGLSEQRVQGPRHIAAMMIRAVNMTEAAAEIHEVSGYGATRCDHECRCMLAGTRSP